MNLIEITELAWIKIYEKLENSGCDKVRVSLKPSGCVGFKYNFDLTNDIAKNESFLENNNCFLLIDPKSEIFLAGSTLDWVKYDEFNEGFDFINPLELNRCGCGESVSFDNSLS